MPETLKKNMNLLSHSDLGGFGGVGEGMALQVTNRNKRILWIAHEGPPKNFTGVDVTDPKNLEIICQTELPHKNMRSNSLEVTGDILAVAYQVYELGLEPAGIELFDISDPEAPKSIGLHSTSGPYSRGVHCLWFVDGEYVHISSGARDFKPRHPRDDQFYQIIDVRNPSKMEEVGRWWYPGTREGDDEEPPVRINPASIDDTKAIDAFRLHNANVYPNHPDRAYLGYTDGGAVILDISNKSKPQVISNWSPHNPYPGFTHTVLPLFDRGLLVVTDECLRDNGEDWPKLTWVIDARNEKNLVPISTLPLPSVSEFGNKGGRFGSHNLHENRPGPSFFSEEIIIGAFFNAGIRVYNLKDPYQPELLAYFIPPGPKNSRVNTIQMNEVYVDENGIVYAGDRWAGGLYVLEMDI